MSAELRREAMESREMVARMLSEVQDLAMRIRFDVALDEEPATLLRETHQISNLIGQINTQIRGYGRHWL